MRITLGSDHRGLELKNKLAAYLSGHGHQVSDEGAFSTASIDYPDVASAVGRKVAGHEADRGVLVCATGVGMSITANKIRGVRATICPSEHIAKFCRQHNDVNVLCLAGDIPEEQAAKMVQTWLDAEFEGGRHAQRLGKIAAVETEQRGSC